MIRNPTPGSSVDISAAALSSMIDIIFQLIIFFVVTASFDAAQLDSKVQLPQVFGSAAITSMPPERIIVNVQADGTVSNGFVTVPAAEVEAKLPAILQQAGKASTSVLIVNGDANARHWAIAPVLTAAALAGFTDVRINALIEKSEK